MMRFNSKYFYLAILLFGIEVLIAMPMTDQFIRPFVGDVLVVILIYCVVRAFWNVKATVAIASVFLFACWVECLQYLNVVDRLGLRQNRLIAVIVGTVFDWKDIMAYAIGCAIVWLWETRSMGDRSKRESAK